MMFILAWGRFAEVKVETGIGRTCAQAQGEKSGCMHGLGSSYGIRVRLWHESR